MVCDHRAVITHCEGGHPGSVHDHRVFRWSEVLGYLDDEEKFPRESHILGDAACELHQHLLTAFKDDGYLTRRQKNYNFKHSVARVAVERCIGLLKARMRSLLHCLPMSRVHLMAEYFVACCVVHNICMLRRDDIDVIAIPTPPNETNHNCPEARHNARQNAGIQKRNLIMNALEYEKI